MTDWRRFLGTSSVTLPYFGGPFVEGPVPGPGGGTAAAGTAARGGTAGSGGTWRRLRVTGQVEPGWWRFAVEGRTARAVERAEQPPLERHPKVRGHLSDGYLSQAGGRVQALSLPPEAPPPRFAPVVTRRWGTGDLLLDVVEFETGAEEEARLAFEDRRPLAGVGGVPATLRAAFGYAVALRVAAECGVPVSPLELRGDVAALAGGGDEAAGRVIARLVAERARDAALRRAREPLGTLPTGPAREPEERVVDALRAAGASLLDLRRLDGRMLEVRYRFLGERFGTVVAAGSLQVVDAGICLSGHDDLLTLESLPGVIKEAMDRGELVRTRGG